MSAFKYQEPEILDQGRHLFDSWAAEDKKGNIISILSNAMTVLRQLGPTGLDIWIACNDNERSFIRTVLAEEIDEATNQTEMNRTWALIENLMRTLRYAKYYAKTQKEST